MIHNTDNKKMLKENLIRLRLTAELPIHASFRRNKRKNMEKKYKNTLGSL